MRKGVALYASVLFLLAHSWMFADISVPNERSRVYLSVAIVDHGTLSIDTSVARFGRILDWARFEGRAYTDKAPGSSLLGVLPYAVARVFTSPEDWTIAQLVRLMRTWVMLPIALLGFFVMRRVLHDLGADDHVATLGAGAWCLGTSAFHYGQAFYGHQIVGVMLVTALWFVLRVEHGHSTRPALECALAGLCAGVAGLTEYQAGVPCVLLAAYLLSGSARCARHVAAFSLGTAPCLAMLLAYNTIAFGGPFELSYHYLVVPHLAELHREGVGGVATPRAALIRPVLFSLHRGWLVTSPVFVLVPLGLGLMWRSGRRRLCALVGATALFYFLLVISTRAWFGGWSFGPRLLVPGMGWSMIAATFPLVYWNSSVGWSVLTRGLIACGFVYHQLVHVVLPELPPSVTNPLLDVTLPALRQGVFAPNVVSWLTGTSSLWTLSPMAIVAAAWLLFVLWTPTSLGEPRDEEPHADARAISLESAPVHAAAAASCLSAFFAVVLVVGPGLPAQKSAQLLRTIATWQANEHER
ncbi:MAG: hypothetical protein AAGI01_02620 [Myxococcota bacterium]